MPLRTRFCEVVIVSIRGRPRFRGAGLGSAFVLDSAFVLGSALAEAALAEDLEADLGWDLDLLMAAP
jgi:hypothetical protein